MNFDECKYRQTLSLFTTGVSIVTLPKSATEVIGITINSLTSVSLDPPLVLFCIKRTAEAYAGVMSCPEFGINILSQDQATIAKKCTMKGGFSLSNQDYQISKNKVPLINQSLATLECVRQDIHQGGDHSIIVAKVKSLHENNVEKGPLVFFRSSFTSLADAKDEMSRLKAV